MVLCSSPRHRDPGPPSSAGSDNGLSNSSCTSLAEVTLSHPWPSADAVLWEAYLCQEWSPVDCEVAEAQAQMQEQLCKLAAELRFANNRIAALSQQVEELSTQLAASTAALNAELLRCGNAEQRLEVVEGANASLREERDQGRSILETLQHKFSLMRSRWQAERDRAAYAQKAARTIAAEVVMISCCPHTSVARDLSCSGDHLKGQLSCSPPTTFFTAFLRAIHANPSISLAQLVESLSVTLAAASSHPRIPILASSHLLDLQAPLQAKPNPTGRTKLLLAAIHYRGQRVHLSDSVPEARSVVRWLSFEGFSAAPDCLLTLADDGMDGRPLPTHANIMNGFQWLVQGIDVGDNLFFIYCGHGAQRRRGPADPVVNALLPLDYEAAGPITEQMVFHALIAKLPKGVRLTVLMDCYHSGPAVALPYTFHLNPNQTVKAEECMVPNPGFCYFTEKAQ